MTALCIDFGGTNIKLGLLRDGTVVASTEFPVTGTVADLTTAEQAAREMVAGVSVSGIGIAVPGAVSRRTGRLVKAHGKYGYLDGLDLRQWAEVRFGAQAFVENDARAALLGESTFGCAEGATDAVMVTLGTGIGTAALLDGVLLRGAHDHAGILGGHVTVDVNAPQCPCGNIGCAEVLASTWALEGLLRAHPGFASSTLAGQLAATGSIGIKGVADAALRPDPDEVARELLGRFARVWGAVIVGLCHAYDPDVVIVSGGVMRAKDALLPQLEGYVGAHLWSSSHRPRFVSPQLPELSVLRGLAVIARPSTGLDTPQPRSNRGFE